MDNYGTVDNSARISTVYYALIRDRRPWHTQKPGLQCPAGHAATRLMTGDRRRDGPGGVERGIGVPKHELIVRGGLVFKNGEKNIKNGKPGEGTMNVPLPCALFRIEGDVTESVEAFNIPFGKGIRCAGNSVA